MLAKENRLNKAKDYGKVFKRSRPVFSEHMAIRKVTNHSNASRFGFVVSNKISKRATKRNALRRKLRSVIQTNLPMIDKGFDFVILVKKDFPLPYNFDQVREELMYLLSK